MSVRARPGAMTPEQFRHVVEHDAGHELSTGQCSRAALDAAVSDALVAGECTRDDVVTMIARAIVSTRKARLR